MNRPLIQTAALVAAIVSIAAVILGPMWEAAFGLMSLAFGLRCVSDVATSG